MLSAWRSPSGAAIPTRRPAPLQQPQGGERAEQPAARAPSPPAWPPVLLLAVAAVAVPLALNLVAGDPAAAQLLSPATASAASALPGLRGPRPAVRQAPAVADFWDPMVKLEVTRLQPITPEAAKSLISDFSYTVYQNYYDAYDTGFSRDKWLRLIHDALEEKYQYREDVYARLSQLLAKANVDKYTYFLRPQEIQAMLKYDVSGVGLNLVNAEEFRRQAMQPVAEVLEPVADDEVMVVSVLVGSAAEKLGIKVGDVVDQVDGVSVRGRATFPIMELIHGDGADTAARPAVLQLRRGADGQPATVEIPRPGTPTAAPSLKTELKVEAVDGRPMKRGYLSLSEFNSRSPTDIKAAIQKLEAEGAEDFILDLRGNPGGLAQDAVEIAGLFLGSDRPITYTVSNAGSLLERVDPGTVPVTAKPLIVRVNFGSASAAEILAAALRDNCRAPLVGTKTFGKAAIQGIYQFGDGSGVKMTIGKYLTPLKQDINRRGIEPDFFMLPSPREATEVLGPQCRAALAAVPASP
eukprot:EG_transcript_7821